MARNAAVVSDITVTSNILAIRSLCESPFVEARAERPNKCQDLALSETPGT